jgi:DNA end-binding protein Ku
MVARSTASVSISFGLVSIPVKVFSATEASKGGISFNLLHSTCGSRLRQQYMCIKEEVPVPREEIVKGYEFAKDQYVMFDAGELKALEEVGTHTVEITEFVPAEAIDPVYYDKAYYLTPDKGGAKPYALLAEALRRSSRTALGRWAARGKQYIVQLRPVDDGLVMQQLLYADEVRKLADLEVAPSEVKESEVKLALQLIEQGATDTFHPEAYTDQVKTRIEAAVQKKVEGQEISVSEEPSEHGGKVIDLMDALRASLAKKGAAPARAATAASNDSTPAHARTPAAPAKPERKPAKKAQREAERPRRVGTK